MMWFLVVVCIVVIVLLALVSGIDPRPSTLGAFELKRRREAGDRTAAEALRRDTLLADVLSLQRVVAAILLVIFVPVAVATFGWFFGIVVAIVVALEYGTLGRTDVVRRQARKLYTRYEPDVLRFVEKFTSVFRVIRSVSPVEAVQKRLESREELGHLVEGSGTLLSADEKKLILHGLQFNIREVSEVMTPRGVIDSISQKELLGPLVLDDLHKTGHSRFPVIDGDIDHVVGMLYIQDLLTLDAKKRSATVEKAMEPRVFYIHENQTLDHALAAFLRTRHHLFVVVNEYRETVGLLSLEDVIEALLGRKIVDEFDAHEDLRAVAARNPRGNNRPEKREDV